MKVYALPRTGDKFLMFITDSMEFAHKNARDTRWLYPMFIDGYEINGETYSFNNIMPWGKVYRP